MAWIIALSQKKTKSAFYQKLLIICRVINSAQFLPNIVFPKNVWNLKFFYKI
ncbi:hypothetical protein MXB_4375 [Myxobolus squamalis]|nr:hypothetical protein MXB_4375 [Myxobolus squamalis]